MSYYPTLRETGAVFVCRWQQLAKVGCHLSYHNHHPPHDDHHHHQIMIMLQTGELLYSGEERAPPLLVLLPPEVRYRRHGSNCPLDLDDDNQGSARSGHLPGLETWSHNLGSDQGEAKTSGHFIIALVFLIIGLVNIIVIVIVMVVMMVVMAGALVGGDTERQLDPSGGDAGRAGRVQVSPLIVIIIVIGTSTAGPAVIGITMIIISTTDTSLGRLR